MKTIIKLVIALLLLAACVNAGRALYRNYQFEDAVHDALLFNTRASEREIVDLVTKTAADYDVPIGADDISVQVVGSDVTVDMPYTEHVVPVPGVYAIDWTFTPTTTIRRLQGVGR